MKNNLNKILLEAINKGIKFALDDFNDDELIGQQTLIIKDQNITKDYLDYLTLMEHVVDLGLPSGTLWCKYNLDVDSNLLSTPEDWYGKYYAWGELEPNKTNYGWNTYKFAKDSFNNLTKYCNNPKYGLNRSFFDNLTLLLPEDDVAYLNKKLHNFKFHIPTKELFEELINYTTNYRVKNYNPNKLVHNPKNDCGIKRLNGYIFEGKNGNLMFIPAAGYHRGFEINDVGSAYYLWSSSLYLNGPDKAYNFESNYISMHNYYRYFGYNIRPVINL